MRLLVVEDDALLRDSLLVGLRLSGFTPDGVETCADASAALATASFDGIVLDRMLPDGSGLDWLKGQREAGMALPVLMLTARDRVPDRVDGLDGGADDYMGKPFDLDELAARLRAMLRRGEGGRAAPEIAWNGLRLDPATMRGTIGGAPVDFSRRELAVLTALLERPGQILSKAALEDRLYGWGEGVESNALEVHVHKLRAKLGAGFIETVRGVGYRLGDGGAG